MTFRFRILILNVICLFFVFSSNTSAQEVFSIDAGSGAPFAAGDILVPGPTVSFSDSSIAMGGVLTGVEIDGLSDGSDFGTDLLFSVDSMSMGAAGTDVFAEFTGGGAGPLDQAADIYRNPLTTPGLNSIFRDGDGIANPLTAPGPAFGLTEPFPILRDNTDAYDFGGMGSPSYSGPIFFTVGAASSGGLATDAIHFVSSPGAAISTYTGGLALSLTAPDDIDAIFVLDDGDLIFGASDFVGFSLDRGAPSLSAGSALSLLFTGGAALSAADVFITTGSGGTFYVPAASHGLLFNDNIDALDQISAVPEPGSASLFCLSVLGLASYRKRRSR